MAGAVWHGRVLRRSRHSAWQRGQRRLLRHAAGHGDPEEREVHHRYLPEEHPPNRRYQLRKRVEEGVRFLQRYA